MMNYLLRQRLSNQPQALLCRIASHPFNRASANVHTHAHALSVYSGHTHHRVASKRRILNGTSSRIRPLSSVAIASNTVPEPTVPSKRTRKAVNPLIVTKNAASRIKELLSGDTAEGALGIRLGVKRRGCNGLSYTLNYAFETPKKDEKMEAHGVQIFIEPMALFNVVGTVMDYEESDLASEFTFNNPNSKGECGCGESFNV